MGRKTRRHPQLMKIYYELPTNPRRDGRGLMIKNCMLFLRSTEGKQVKNCKKFMRGYVKNPISIYLFGALSPIR
jgi:hypothetical protein